MSYPIDSYDAVVIGGGFYGCAIASHLASKPGFNRVCIVEKEYSLFNRASLNNQYRVHNGYHYPRSFNTANRSRANFKKFIKDWPTAIISNFNSLYAIPKQNSKVNAFQFEQFAKLIGSRLASASPAQKKLFNTHYFDGIYQAEECCYNPLILKNLYISKLEKLNVALLLDTKVNAVIQDNDSYGIEIERKSSQNKKITSSMVFNCTYSGLNQIGGDLHGPITALKHEIAELVLFKKPKALSGVGITIMDGPFFSILPTENNNILSLSHVRYTPHLSWRDEKKIDPYILLNNYQESSHYSRMFRAAQKWIPSMTEESYIASKYEIKTILEKNEIDDGRPILFERDKNLKNIFYILGSKIDNIFDVLERIDEEL